MNDKIKDWLMDSHPLLKYRVASDFGYDGNLSDLKKEALEDPVIKELISDLEKWPGHVLKRHNDAKHFIHKLSFLADMDFTIENKDINDISKRVMEHKSDEEVYQIKMNIPVVFGGTGKDQYSWMLCDAPLLIYSLKKTGIPFNQLRNGIEYLSNLTVEDGYPCAVSPELGRFNGPGKRGTPCPYANLLMAKMFSLFPEKHKETNVGKAVEFLLSHWKERKKHYLFGIGTDFQKLKYPFVWYDILHFADILSHYNHIKNDLRFIDIIETIKKKADPEGLYKAESVWMAWKILDSGQKKEPSRWITYNVYRILKRVYTN